MKNCKLDFKVIYRINFLMEASTFSTKHEGIVIESKMKNRYKIYYKFILKLIQKVLWSIQKI